MVHFCLEDFWIYRDGSDPSIENGFEIFSTAHVLWLAFLFLLTLIYTISYRRSGDKGRANMRKGLAFVLIIYEILHQCIGSFVGVPRGLYLPLEICSLGEYTILIDAMWPENRLTKQLLAFAFLPAAGMALMFPTATVYPPISIFAIHQFVMHGAIVAYIVARYSEKEIKPRYPGIWMSAIIIGIIIVPIYHIDKFFGVNYMFIMRDEGNPVLGAIWNLTGGGGGISYILGLATLVILVMHIMFLIYKVLGNRRTKRK